MLKYVVDFDDLTDENVHKLGVLVAVREKWPTFKATIFAIPNRINAANIEQVKHDYPYLSLAPHGYEHTKGECIAWTKDEALDKIKKAIDKGIDGKSFRAPGWLIARPTYEACEELGLTVCAHRDMYIGRDIAQYVYNMPNGRASKVRSTHGHITPVMDNHILDMAVDGRLTFPSKVEFIDPCDAAVVIKPVKEAAE